MDVLVWNEGREGEREWRQLKMLTSRYSRTRRTQMVRIPSSLLASTQKIRDNMNRNGYPEISNVDVMEELSNVVEREVGRIKVDLTELLKEPNGTWKRRRSWTR